MITCGDYGRSARQLVKVVNPMDEPAYLKGLCLCTDVRDCWHGSCRVWRQLRCSKVLLENGAGNVLLAERRQVTVKGESPKASKKEKER